MLFNTINVHGYFMEYDSERAGGFEPLRFVPKGKQVVLGLVTSKTGTLEIQGRDQAPHRRGGEVRAARSALPVAAMRLCLQRGGQHAGRGGAMGEASHDRRDRRRGVGKVSRASKITAVIAGLDPAISIDLAGLCHKNRDGRDKPGHDGANVGVQQQ